METIEAIHGRRSIRDYEPRGVPRELIELVLLDAAQAPTPPVSGNQPFVFVVIEGLTRVSECGALALRFARENRQPGPAYDWVERADFSVFFNAPAVVVICGFDDGYGQAPQDCNRAGQNSCFQRTRAGSAPAGWDLRCSGFATRRYAPTSAFPSVTALMPPLL